MQALAFSSRAKASMPTRRTDNSGAAAAPATMPATYDARKTTYTTIRSWRTVPARISACSIPPNTRGAATVLAVRVPARRLSGSAYARSLNGLADCTAYMPEPQPPLISTCCLWERAVK